MLMPLSLCNDGGYTCCCVDVFVKILPPSYSVDNWCCKTEHGIVVLDVAKASSMSSSGTRASRDLAAG
jgi:hypothetical protein